MGLAIRYVYRQIPRHRLEILEMGRSRIIYLGTPPSSDVVEYLADLMCHRELGYYVIPKVVHRVAVLLQKEIRNIVTGWDADVFRELLESVRLEFGYSDLRFAARNNDGFNPTSRT